MTLVVPVTIKRLWNGLPKTLWVQRKRARKKWSWLTKKSMKQNSPSECLKCTMTRITMIQSSLGSTSSVRSKSIGTLLHWFLTAFKSCSTSLSNYAMKGYKARIRCKAKISEESMLHVLRHILAILWYIQQWMRLLMTSFTRKWLILTGEFYLTSFHSIIFLTARK